MPEWLVALLGVAVGFLLNTGYTHLKEAQTRKELLKALEDELNTNLHQIKQKEDIAQQIQKALQGGGLMAGLSVPFATTVYEHHFPRIIEVLTPLQRDNIRHIYENLKVLDFITGTFEDDYKKDKQSGIYVDTEAVYIGKIQSVRECHNKLLGLIKNYLEGRPVDIYYRKGQDT